MTEFELPEPGDVLFLEREIPHLPYPTGYWAVWTRNDESFSVRLLSQVGKDFTGTGPMYPVPWDQLGAFRMAGEFVGQRMLAEVMPLDEVD